MRTILMAALAAGLLPAAAGAHTTLETDEAAAGSYWKAVLRVPHGCEGQATETVEVTIPEGLIAVKPMPKPGWTLEVETGPYAQATDNDGEALTEGVRTIRWSGGSLPDAYYDEFVFRAKIADSVAKGAMLPIKTVQICASAEARWDEVAAAGQDPHALEHPAPLLRVMAAAGADAHAGHARGAGGGAATLGDLTISGAVARASIGNSPTSAVYMTITTAGVPDRLVAVASPAAQAVELHRSLEEGGVAKMQPVESVPVAPDAPAELAPGGYHVMLIGLADRLEDGTTVPVTLTFENAGEITLDVPVSKDVAAHMH
jgi:uncharacterized protein YcnI/copper(I)-binding protein